MTDIHFGQPGHFICADRCRFHLHTHVGVTESVPHGRWCVSTVGEYYARPGDDEPTPLGGLGPGQDPKSQTYETMVFELDDEGETADWSNRDGERYATRNEANAGHARYCDMWRIKETHSET